MLHFHYCEVLQSDMVSCSLREACQKVKEKSLPELDQQKKRAEFLPVEWRSSLKLDGGKQLSGTRCMFHAMECIVTNGSGYILHFSVASHTEWH